MRPWLGKLLTAYDTRRPLVIDPTLIYSTYLGGGALDLGWGIAVDLSGNAYVTGETQSINFPASPGAFQTSSGGGQADAFVAKLNPTGSALVYLSRGQRLRIRSRHRRRRGR